MKTNRSMKISGCWHEKHKNRVLSVEDDKGEQRDFIRLLKNEDFPYEYTIAGSVSEEKKILGMERLDM